MCAGRMLAPQALHTSSHNMASAAMPVRAGQLARCCLGHFGDHEGAEFLCHRYSGIAWPPSGCHLVRKACIAAVVWCMAACGCAPVPCCDPRIPMPAWISDEAGL